jgi:hypothetical protein
MMIMWFFAPPKALHAFAVRAAAFVDVLRDGGRADKADAGDRVVVEDRVDRFLVTVDDLQDTVGQARLLHQFGQHHRARRVTFRGLQDEGVAADKCRGHFPHRDHGGEVERRDSGSHANGLAHGIHVDTGARAVGVFALQQMRRADAELDHLKAALHVALGVGDGLAVFAAQRLGQLVHVAVQEADEGHHYARTPLRVRGGPADLRARGVGHGGLDLGGGGECHLRLHLTCGRVPDIRGAP